MQWSQLIQVVGHICQRTKERKVLLVLTTRSHHVKSVLNLRESFTDDMVGFEVYADDPEISNRTEVTRLLFVRPSEIKQIVLDEFPPRLSGVVGSRADLPPGSELDGSAEDAVAGLGV